MNTGSGASAATTQAAAGLMRRVGEWFVEPAPAPPAPDLRLVPRAAHPVVGVVGLAKRCGATTLARALGVELAGRAAGAAVVAAAEPPAVVALGSTAPAVGLAQASALAGRARAAGRLCLVACDGPEAAADEIRALAPAVFEIAAGAAAVASAPHVDRMLLVATPAVEPALAAAVAETIAAVARPPLVVVNRAADHGPWLVHADLLVPDARMGARLALAGREPRGWLGRSIVDLADLCTGA